MKLALVTSSRVAGMPPMHPAALARQIFFSVILLIFLSNMAQATSLNEALPISSDAG